MIDSKTYFRGILTADSALTALVPADRIWATYPQSFATLPVIAYGELNNVGSQYADNRAMADDIEMEVHVYDKKSPTPIAIAIDKALSDDLWHRGFSTDMIEAETGFYHKVMRYYKKILAI